MSIKSKVLAGAAALSVIGGGVGVAAATANASTPSCGSSCVNIYSTEFGHHFVVDTFKQGDFVGNKVILFNKNNSDPAQDFTYAEQGKVSDFYSLGLVSAGLDLHYASNTAVEIQYSPYGSGGNGLCLSTAATASNGTAVTLQPCGVSSKTTWVEVQTSHGDVLINGSDTNFSHPYVLTYPGNSYPTDKPRAGLETWGLNSFSDGTIPSNMLWRGL
jgi:hypothetical protein